MNFPSYNILGINISAEQKVAIPQLSLHNIYARDDRTEGGIIRRGLIEQCAENNFELVVSKG